MFDINIKKLVCFIGAVPAFLFVFARPSFALELSITENGSQSVSSIEVTSHVSQTVVSSNELSVTNIVNSKSETGQNSVTSNNQNTKVETGDSASETQVETTGNTSNINPTKCCAGATSISPNNTSVGTLNMNTISISGISLTKNIKLEKDSDKVKKEVLPDVTITEATSISTDVLSEQNQATSTTNSAPITVLQNNPDSAGINVNSPAVLNVSVSEPEKNMETLVKTEPVVVPPSLRRRINSQTESFLSRADNISSRVLVASMSETLPPITQNLLFWAAVFNFSVIISSLFLVNSAKFSTSITLEFVW